MYKIGLLVVTGFLIPLMSGGPGEKKYGKTLTLKDPVKISRLLDSLEGFQGKKVLVEGEITAVCQKKGCWIRVQDESSAENVLIKVEDDVIVFPKDAKGRKVKAEGIVQVRFLTEQQRRERARHEAEEQGSLKEFDASAMVGPASVLQINGEGAMIEE